MSYAEFTGKLEFLSNFYPCAFTYQGHTWWTVEHAFQASKTTNWRQRAQVWAADSPGKAKRLGHEVTLRHDWDAVKIDVMRELLALKFAPGSDLARRLLETGDKHLEEKNWWGDRFWGTHEGKGENHLGKLLMQQRSELQGNLL